MPLRLRLTLWYGGLTGVVIILLSTLAYVAHARAHYEEVDAHLARAAAHAVNEYLAAHEADDVQMRSFDYNDLGATVRVVDRNMPDPAIASTDQSAPIVDPQEILLHPSGPPYDLVARFVPFEVFGEDVDGGSFSLAVGDDGARWRLYARQIGDDDIYVVAVTSLAVVDESVQKFRRIMLFVIVLGTMVMLAGGWLLAERALRPVPQLTNTAGAIVRLRTFDRRVPVQGADELADMANTFNEMLDNLETVYRNQQQFVSDASHELRAPLTSIQANLEFMRRHSNMPAGERDEVVEEVLDETHRLSRLVGDLLALARADAGVTLRSQPLEFDRLVLDSVDDVRPIAQGRQIIVKTLEPILIEGDSDRLKQLLLILLDNAVKYTARDGLITVTAQVRSGTAELVVSDTGVGISERDLPHVFERFYRADPARSRDPGGTGLGLSIARWIVEAHSGDISTRSSLGKGTTVTVHLPVVDVDGNASNSS